MILFIMLNVQKASAQKTIYEKRHEGCQKEYLNIMVEMLNLMWYILPSENAINALK